MRRVRARPRSTGSRGAAVGIEWRRLSRQLRKRAHRRHTEGPAVYVDSVSTLDPAISNKQQCARKQTLSSLSEPLIHCIVQRRNPTPGARPTRDSIAAGARLSNVSQEVL